MTRITEDLVRKRAEHNECEIFSLEELSLHQEDIEKIEHLDKWCRDLKILYLHNNLIPRIENLSRLKKLQYVNFTLNNIVRVENLEGCESLEKLDLTMNFIGELTSLRNLVQNAELRELYMTGNPCTKYEGYREYVIATLPQLDMLDGENITKTERILANRRYQTVKRDIMKQEGAYLRKNSAVEDDVQDAQSSEDDDFWNKPCKYTPESRIKTYEHLQKVQKKGSKDESKKKKKTPRTLITSEGKVLNVNELKLDFHLDDDEINHCFRLELSTYRYLDSSLIDVDVQPKYVRVTVKGKVLQMRLPGEVRTDESTAQRSSITGHLVITMPKASENVFLKKTPDRKEEKCCSSRKNSEKIETNFLEVSPTIISTLDKIVEENTYVGKYNSDHKNMDDGEKDHGDPNFYDDPSVPPLI